MVAAKREAQKTVKPQPMPKVVEKFDTKKMKKIKVRGIVCTNKTAADVSEDSLKRIHKHFRDQLNAPIDDAKKNQFKHIRLLLTSSARVKQKIKL